MDADTLQPLATLIRSQHVASLGTVRNGAPLVTMVLYTFERDFSSFYLHLSRLAPHTQALLASPPVGLMIAEPDSGEQDPQLLKRVSIQGDAVLMPKGTDEWNGARSLYLNRFPAAITMFGLGDFDLYRIAPETARFVAGFGQAYNLAAGHFKEAAQFD